MVISPADARTASAEVANVAATPLHGDVTHDAIENEAGTAEPDARFEALGRVAGSVAHDFANLVHVISGYTELALREDVPESARAALRVVQDTATRASALARQLLQFSRQHPMPPQAVNWRTTLEAFVPVLSRLAGDVELEYTVNDALGAPVVWGHSAQFEQILLNLVVNAREAQPNGGIVRLALEVLPAAAIQPPTTVASLAALVVRLSVDDDGPGIPPVLRRRVLDPFFTTKRHGTGLGLATVADIVRDAGGELRLSDANEANAPLGGLHVEVLLPCGVSR